MSKEVVYDARRTTNTTLLSSCPRADVSKPEIDSKNLPELVAAMDKLPPEVLLTVFCLGGVTSNDILNTMQANSAL